MPGSMHFLLYVDVLDDDEFDCSLLIGSHTFTGTQVPLGMRG